MKAVKSSHCSSKKKHLILFFGFSLVIIILLLYLLLKPSTLSPSDRIIFAENLNDKYTLIDINGNCFIRDSLGMNGDNLGLTSKDKKIYKLRFQMFAENSFVKFYNGQNAERICLFSDGGAIITNSNLLYVFLADEKKYSTPTFFCNDIKKAKRYGDKILVLTTDNTFGYYFISDNQIFL